jgi:nitroimidazol reductase NimA-like FMN-containing flavoprotein (pyridoxamine 5'-phosphate oxidase superfamily)
MVGAGSSSIPERERRVLLSPRTPVCASPFSEKRLSIEAYRSALVEGKAALLTERAEREQTLRMIVAKYDPRAAHRPFAEEILARTLVYSVPIDAISFKQRPRRSQSTPPTVDSAAEASF